MSQIPDLVTHEWLSQHINDDTIQLIDVSYFMPSLNRDAATEFAEKTIPGGTIF